MAINEVVAIPKSSAPIIAAITTSLPVLIPPSVLKITSCLKPFNVTTLNWESMCTTNVSYNTPTTNKFTIDAQIGNFATEAYLSYSSTSVNNWTPIPNIAGDVVISAISWNTGLIYDDPDSSFILRVTFVSGSCELYGPVI